MFVIYFFGFSAGYALSSATGRDGTPTYVVIGAHWGTSGIRAAACIAAIFAIAGFALRWWGSSYHRAGVVYSGSIETATLTAAGPYRFVRNPLYLGNMLQAVGISSIGPPPVEVICVGLIVAFLMRLIFLEERYLRAAQGEPYLRYCAAVPRIIPRLNAPDLPTTGQRPDVAYGFLTELWSLGFAVAMSYLAVTSPRTQLGTFFALFYASIGLLIVGAIIDRRMARPRDAG